MERHIIRWYVYYQIAIIIAAILICIAGYKVHAEDYTKSPYYGWAEKQMVMPSAVPRICKYVGANVNCSCCNGAEIIKTRFRVARDSADAWDWLNPLKNKWERVPSDIIHWDEPTPTKEGVMFVYPIGSDTPRCFFPPQDGGG